MFWTGFVLGGVVIGLPLALVAINNHEEALMLREAARHWAEKAGAELIEDGAGWWSRFRTRLYDWWLRVT